jgi:DNA repair protein RecO (recombination protein O)
MSRTSRRVELTQGYLLHHRPWRDTSRILEVLTREYGRLTLFARAVRGPAAKLAAVLQPFQPLLLSWSGRGEAPALTGAERARHAPPLPPPALLAGFYLNELLLRLTTRHDPQPELFDQYAQALERLRAGGALEPPLRLFEQRLLELSGYAVDLAAEAHSGKRIEAAGYYHFRPGEGLIATRAGSAGALAGSSLLALARGELHEARALEDARQLLQAALSECLEGRPLATRAVARSMAGSTGKSMKKAAR